MSLSEFQNANLNISPNENIIVFKIFTRKLTSAQLKSRKSNDMLV